MLLIYFFENKISIFPRRFQLENIMSQFLKKKSSTGNFSATLFHYRRLELLANVYVAMPSQALPHAQFSLNLEWGVTVLRNNHVFSHCCFIWADPSQNVFEVFLVFLHVPTAQPHQAYLLIATTALFVHLRRSSQTLTCTVVPATA